MSDPVMDDPASPDAPASPDVLADKGLFIPLPWPEELPYVEVLRSYKTYLPNSEVTLPTLLQYTILKEKDPRLRSDVLETSVYFRPPDMESPASPTSEVDSRTSHSVTVPVKEIPSKRDELMSALAKRRAEKEEVTKRLAEEAKRNLEQAMREVEEAKEKAEAAAKEQELLEEEELAKLQAEEERERLLLEEKRQKEQFEYEERLRKKEEERRLRKKEEEKRLKELELKKKEERRLKEKLDEEERQQKKRQEEEQQMREIKEKERKLKEQEREKKLREEEEKREQERKEGERIQKEAEEREIKVKQEEAKRIQQKLEEDRMKHEKQESENQEKRNRELVELQITQQQEPNQQREIIEKRSASEKPMPSQIEVLKHIGNRGSEPGEVVDTESEEEQLRIKALEQLHLAKQKGPTPQNVLKEGIPKPHFARRTAANLVSPRAKVRPASQDEQAESASKVNTWIEASQQYFPQDSDEEVESVEKPVKKHRSKRKHKHKLSDSTPRQLSLPSLEDFDEYGDAEYDGLVQNKPLKRKHDHSKHGSKKHQKRLRHESREKNLCHFVDSIVKSAAHQESDLIQGLLASSQDSVFTALDQLCNGDKPQSEHVPYKHFNSLSLSTELESTFLPECATIKSAHIQTLRKWMQDKPLDKLIVGKLGRTVPPEPIKQSQVVDDTMKECLEEFNTDVYHLMRGGVPQPDHDTVYPVPSCLSEETVNQVFNDVKQDLDILLESESSKFANNKVCYSPHNPTEDSEISERIESSLCTDNFTALEATHRRSKSKKNKHKRSHESKSKHRSSKRRCNDEDVYDQVNNNVNSVLGKFYKKIDKLTGSPSDASERTRIVGGVPNVSIEMFGSLSSRCRRAELPPCSSVELIADAEKHQLSTALNALVAAEEKSMKSGRVLGVPPPPSSKTTTAERLTPICYPGLLIKSHTNAVNVTQKSKQHTNLQHKSITGESSKLHPPKNEVKTHAVLPQNPKSDISKDALKQRSEVLKNLSKPKTDALSEALKQKSIIRVDVPNPRSDILKDLGRQNPVSTYDSNPISDVSKDASKQKFYIPTSDSKPSLDMPHGDLPQTDGVADVLKQKPGDYSDHSKHKLELYSQKSDEVCTRLKCAPESSRDCKTYKIDSSKECSKQDTDDSKQSSKNNYCDNKDGSMHGSSDSREHSTKKADDTRNHSKLTSDESRDSLKQRGQSNSRHSRDRSESSIRTKSCSMKAAEKGFPEISNKSTIIDSTVKKTSVSTPSKHTTGSGSAAASVVSTPIVTPKSDLMVMQKEVVKTVAAIVETVKQIVQPTDGCSAKITEGVQTSQVVDKSSSLKPAEAFLPTASACSTVTKVLGKSKTPVFVMAGVKKTSPPSESSKVEGFKPLQMQVVQDSVKSTVTQATSRNQLGTTKSSVSKTIKIAPVTTVGKDVDCEIIDCPTTSSLKYNILVDAGIFKDSIQSYVKDTLGSGALTKSLNAGSLWWSIVNYYRNEDHDSVTYLKTLCPNFLTCHADELKPSHTVLWVVALTIDEYEKAMSSEKKTPTSTKSGATHINEYGSEVNVKDNKPSINKRKSALSMAFKHALEAKKKKTADGSGQTTESNLFSIFRNKILSVKDDETSHENLVDVTLAITDALQQKVQMTLTHALELFENELSKQDGAKVPHTHHQCPLSVAAKDIFKVPESCFTALEKDKLAKLAKKPAKRVFFSSGKIIKDTKIRSKFVGNIKSITSVNIKSVPTVPASATTITIESVGTTSSPIISPCKPAMPLPTTPLPVNKPVQPTSILPQISSTPVPRMVPPPAPPLAFITPSRAISAPIMSSGINVGDIPAPPPLPTTAPPPPPDNGPAPLPPPNMIRPPGIPGDPRTRPMIPRDPRTRPMIPGDPRTRPTDPRIMPSTSHTAMVAGTAASLPPGKPDMTRPPRHQNQQGPPQAGEPYWDGEKWVIPGEEQTMHKEKTKEQAWHAAWRILQEKKAKEEAERPAPTSDLPPGFMLPAWGQPGGRSRPPRFMRMPRYQGLRQPRRTLLETPIRPQMDAPIRHRMETPIRHEMETPMRHQIRPLPSFHTEAPHSTGGVLLNSLPACRPPPKMPEIIKTKPSAMSHSYVFKSDTVYGHNLKTYLTSLWQKNFDPYSIEHVTECDDFTGAVVYFSKQDIDQIQFIPNLLGLKENSTVKFVLYETVDDVRQENISNVFNTGGMIIPDDTALLICSPDTVKKLCQYLADQQMDGIPWVLQIGGHIMDHINIVKQRQPDDCVRMGKIYEILCEFANVGVVQFMRPPKYNTRAQPSSQYSDMLLQLQADNMDIYRQFIFLTDLSPESQSGELLVNSGIDIMTVASFIRKMTKQETEPTTDVPFPYYGKRALYADDAVLSFATDSIVLSFEKPSASALDSTPPTNTEERDKD